MSHRHPFQIRVLMEADHLLLIAPDPAVGWALNHQQALTLAKELVEQASLLKCRQVTTESHQRPTSGPTGCETIP